MSVGCVGSGADVRPVYRLPGAQSLALRLRVRPLVTLQNGLGIFPPAQFTQVLEGHMLQLRPSAKEAPLRNLGRALTYNKQDVSVSLYWTEDYRC